jgi:hypothetical protein
VVSKLDCNEEGCSTDSSDDDDDDESDDSEREERVKQQENKIMQMVGKYKNINSTISSWNQ